MYLKDKTLKMLQEGNVPSKMIYIFLANKEEYEKCNVLNKLMKKHYVGNKKKQIELHMNLDKFNSLY
jgi:hypothetical protein